MSPVLPLFVSLNKPFAEDIDLMSFPCLTSVLLDDTSRSSSITFVPVHDHMTD